MLLEDLHKRSVKLKITKGLNIRVINILYINVENKLLYYLMLPICILNINAGYTLKKNIFKSVHYIVYILHIIIQTINITL